MGQFIEDALGLAATVAVPFTGGASAFLPTLLGGAAGLAGVGNQIAQEDSQNAAARAAQGNESGALSNATQYGQSLAQGPYLQDIINAEGSGTQTLKANGGGIANLGALLKSMNGQNVGNAIQGSLGQRSSNLQGAINAALGTAGRYGTMSAAAGNNIGNFSGPASGLFSSLSQYLKRPGSQPGGQTTDYSNVLNPTSLFGPGTPAAAPTTNYAGFTDPSLNPSVPAPAPTPDYSQGP